MQRQRKLATWLGALLGTLSALLMAGQAHGTERLKEEFHQVYAVNADVRVSLDNINGAAHVTGWDRNEVKLDAVKSANSQLRLGEAKIEVDAASGSISIRTEYTRRNYALTGDNEDNPASVEYTLMVPRGARLDDIRLVNGPLDIQGVAGEVRASCINGQLTARGLPGRLRLSTINNRVDAQFDRLTDSVVELSSVNGPVLLTLPSDAKADLEASTVHGAIDSDFGLRVHRHQWGGRDLRAELGGGGTRIKLANVNGTIEVKHASDGKAVSPAKDMNRSSPDDDEI